LLAHTAPDGALYATAALPRIWSAGPSWFYGQSCKSTIPQQSRPPGKKM